MESHTKSNNYEKREREKNCVFPEQSMTTHKNTLDFSHTQMYDLVWKIPNRIKKQEYLCLSLYTARSVFCMIRCLLLQINIFILRKIEWENMSFTELLRWKVDFQRCWKSFYYMHNFFFTHFERTKFATILEGEFGCNTWYVHYVSLCVYTVCTHKVMYACVCLHVCTV